MWREDLYNLLQSTIGREIPILSQSLSSEFVDALELVLGASKDPEKPMQFVLLFCTFQAVMAFVIEVYKSI